jgi:hypothetical protein
MRYNHKACERYEQILFTCHCHRTISFNVYISLRYLSMWVHAVCIVTVKHEYLTLSCAIAALQTILSLLPPTQPRSNLINS